MTNADLAIIVAHGAPSDPDPLDAAVKRLADRVTTCANNRRVAGATLAKPGSLEAALGLAEPGQRITVYPFFMSEGWFVTKELRRRVSALASGSVNYLEPFGLDPRLPPLCLRQARHAAGSFATDSETVLVLAAHGSQRSSASAYAARTILDYLAARGAFREVRLGFVEEAPTIADAAAGLKGANAVCLPLFATAAGHVLSDIPRQLSDAGFMGAVLPPIGEDEEVPALIADALAAGEADRSAA